MQKPTTPTSPLSMRRLSAIIAAAGASALAGASAPDDTATPAAAAPHHDGCDPVREAFLRHAAGLPMCFPENMTREEMQRAMDQHALLPPAMLGQSPGPRFFTDTVVWTGGAGFGPSGQAAPANLTFSFPDDGVQWGLAGIDPATIGPNELNQQLINRFNDVDRGREHIRQSIAAWQMNTGLRFREVADDNSPMDTSEVSVPWRGDIRIGGADATGATYLGYSAFPSATGMFAVGGGDMYIATNRFTLLSLGDPSNNFRRFRNLVAHELGHGLGMIHTVPCNQTKLMEPLIHTSTDMLTVDEIRGGARNYGGRFAGNHTLADAHDFGDLAPLPGIRRGVSERNLALNGAAGPNNTGSHWYVFTLSEPDIINVFVDPAGGIYDNGQQTTGCNGAVTSVWAFAAGDLALELVDLNTGVSWLANNTQAGDPEFIFTGVVPPSTYALRVSDVGPNAHQIVQLYDLLIFLGSVIDRPPTAVAGVDKRCEANTACWFLGHINSRVNMPGATLVELQWDLIGDGVPDAFLSPPDEAVFFYPSSGDYNVTLWAYDSDGRVATDQITVTVFGATTALSQISPNSAYRGQSVTGTVAGANFKIPTTLALSGTGWTSGTMTPTNSLGTEAEFTLVIDQTATPGLRSVRVTNAEGSDDLIDAFEILDCPGDTNGDLQIDFADIGVVLANFGLCAGDPGYNPVADVNFDGCVDFADLSIVLTNFGNTCP
ncbi:MAG: hypothetical protein EA379_01850 [Phycisphaerales bacterium]|nr:MAG: hypothetical protein EA379_01850 [Phycisphaerales bacterium]